MIFRKNLLALSVTTAIVGLTACGVTPQDDGTGESAGNVSGLAIDGYLFGSIVYADTNKNNKLDSWEPRALTDGDGYFTYNPNTDSNYCDSDTLTDLRHCLRAPLGYDKAIVRISKGYDKTTMEPFSGTLSMEYDFTTHQVSTPAVVTPITALLAHIDASVKADLFTLESIEGSDVNTDFLDFSDTSDLAAEAKRLVLMELALKAHKVADMITGRLDVKFDQGLLASGTADGGFFGVAKGVSNDGADLVYQAIAEQVSSTVSVSDILGDLTKMQVVVDNAYDKIVAVIDEHNDRLLANAEEGQQLVDLSDRFLAPLTKDTTGIADDAVALATLASDLFGSALTEVSITDDNGTPADNTDDSTRTSKSNEDAASRIKALDIVSALMREGKSASAPETARAIALATTDADSAEYLENLRSSKVDVSSLKGTFRSKAGSTQASDANYNGRTSFTGLLTKNNDQGANDAGFTVNNELGLVNNALSVKDEADTSKISSIEFLPPAGVGSDQVDPEADSGVLRISGSVLDEILGTESTEPDPNTEPTVNSIEGTWEQIDPYTMLMNVEIAGVNQPVIIKPTLTDQVNPTTGEIEKVEAYYLDVGGEQKIWTP